MENNILKMEINKISDTEVRVTTEKVVRKSDVEKFLEKINKDLLRLQERKAHFEKLLEGYDTKEK